MSEGTADPLERIGGVRIETNELREALKKTGEPLGLAGVHALQIDEAIARIVDATERGVQDLQRYNQLYGGPRHGAGLAVLGGSPLRSPADFRFLVAQVVANRLSAAAIHVREPDTGTGRGTVRAAVDKVRGLSLLALVQGWQGGSGPGHEDSEDDAA